MTWVAISAPPSVAPSREARRRISFYHWQPLGSGLKGKKNYLQEEIMRVVYERCCGIDMYKKFVVVCLCIITAQGAIEKEIQRFSTMTADLLRMLDWLKQVGCTHAALESTGVYTPPTMLPKRCYTMRGHRLRVGRSES
jgi:hypothetical protein